MKVEFTEYGISLCVVGGKFVGLDRARETLEAERAGLPVPYGLSAASFALLAAMIARRMAPADPWLLDVADRCDAIGRHSDAGRTS